MSTPAERLIPGKTYQVERIDKEAYVVVEGYRHPGGGIYGTEFTSSDDA
jgi:hypothetical protein